MQGFVPLLQQEADFPFPPHAITSCTMESSQQRLTLQPRLMLETLVGRSRMRRPSRAVKMERSIASAIVMNAVRADNGYGSWFLLVNEGESRLRRVHSYMLDFENMLQSITSGDSS